MIAGRGIDFETGLTGEDMVKNADLIAGMTTTDSKGDIGSTFREVSSG